MIATRFLALSFCILSTFFCTAQVSQPISTAGATTDPAERVRLIVQDILEAGGYSTLQIHLRQDRQIRNAMATQVGQSRYIKYNPDFINQFERNAQTQYATYAIFAHEIGHHALGHNFNQHDCAMRKKDELEADGFAGLVLNMMCISLDDATAGFRSMNQDVSSGCYPPPSVREVAVSNGWLERDAYFQKLGRHPCNDQVRFPLRQSDRLAYNRSQNVQAIIKGKRMKITYDLPKDVPFYRVFFSLDPSAPITPKSLHWIGDSTKSGNGRTLIWNFGEDGYTRAQVDKKAEWFGIAAYAPKYVPRPLPGGLRALQIACIVAGAGTTGYGVYLKIDAINLYDRYRDNRNPDASIYINGDMSRQETFKTANKRNKWALGCMVVGTIGTGLSIWWLAKRSKSNKRFKAAHFYSTTTPRIQVESLTLSTDSGPGIGLRARF